MSLYKDIEEVEALVLGISSTQLRAMYKKVDALQRENDAIESTRIRHAISQRLGEIHLLLRDGHLGNI